MKKIRCTSPAGLAVLYSLCAAIWTCLAFIHREEDPLDIVVGCVWLVAVAVQWFRVYRTNKNHKEEA